MRKSALIVFLNGCCGDFSERDSLDFDAFSFRIQQMLIFAPNMWNQDDETIQHQGGETEMRQKTLAVSWPINKASSFFLPMRWSRDGTLRTMLHGHSR